MEDIFAPKRLLDPYLRSADHQAGAYSILTGIAANHSIEIRQPVRIDSLVKGLDPPEYLAMPTGNEPIDPSPLKDSTANRT